MVDGGTNICLTGTLLLLVDTVSIPPMPISVVVEGAGASIADCCTKHGLLPLQLEEGGVYFQPCYYCESAVETIISPQAILNASDTFVEWSQTGYKDNIPGTLRFYSDSGLASMTLTLTKCNGLYYTHTDVLAVDRDPLCHVALKANWLATPPPPKTRATHHNYSPVSKAAHTEAELWMVRLGSPGDDQLDMLPENVTGIPLEFQYHPFRFIDFKEQARIRKQAAQRTAVRTLEAGRRYYMDFGFMWASCSDYRKPNPKTDQVVQSWDGYSSCLLIVDEASCFMWVFLTKSKDPPLDIIDSFLKKFGHDDGGSIRSDQGGELAKSATLADMVLRNHNYVFELTGADSPSQNGVVETYNDKLAVRTRTLLYGADLPAKYWSAVLFLVCVLNNLGIDGVNWIVMISQASS